MSTNFCFKRAAIASLFLSFSFIQSIHSQNLLDLGGWTVGQGSSGIFSVEGTASENIREWGENPYGNRAILWKAQPDGDALADGGWNSFSFAIDHTKMYRFSVWIKKTNSFNGYTYFGCSNNGNLTTLNLDGSVNSNPYFWSGKLPELNKWYLLVGYIHGSGDPSTVNYGGVYDGVTGAKVLSRSDFKFSTAAVYSIHRSYLYYDPDVNDRQYFYSPRVDLVNGDEPSVETLLGLTSNRSGDAFFAGKVGIQTQTPGAYELAVNGKIRAKEIKVEAGNWPDYVFEPSYKTATISDLEAYIMAYKHLPGIPSAKEVEESGISLGEMNAKLLKKIEELTLLLIEEHQKNARQNTQISQLASELSELKKKLLNQ